MNLLALLGLSLALGLRHAADPDHVVAVSAISARTRRLSGAAWLGVVWGLGHTLTLFAAGSAIILFNLAVPRRLGLAFEMAVALALVVVGLLNMNHAHPAPDEPDASGRSGGERIPALRAFVVGLIHGLAGSAAVALLVLATVRSPRWAAAYLIVFGAGTMLGMALITIGIASPLRAAARVFPSFGRWTRLATGALSLLFGIWLIYQIGWRDGLFLAAPNVGPR